VMSGGQYTPALTRGVHGARRSLRRRCDRGTWASSDMDI